ncbi:hypothetical protein [Rhodococcus sp. NPDC003348]
MTEPSAQRPAATSSSLSTEEIKRRIEQMFAGRPPGGQQSG